MSKNASPEQAEYDLANASYQRSWRSGMTVRDRFEAAKTAFLDLPRTHLTEADPIVKSYFDQRDAMERVDIVTAALLAAREAAYEALVRSQEV